MHIMFVCMHALSFRFCEQPVLVGRKKEPWSANLVDSLLMRGRTGLGDDVWSRDYFCVLHILRNWYLSNASEPCSTTTEHTHTEDNLVTRRNNLVSQLPQETMGCVDDREWSLVRPSQTSLDLGGGGGVLRFLDARVFESRLPPFPPPFSLSWVEARWQEFGFEKGRRKRI